MFYGTPCIRMNQAHKPGTETFALNDDKIIVVAGTDKPIKVVREGEGMIIEREADKNADLTQEYVYGEQIGVGVVVAEKIGISAV